MSLLRIGILSLFEVFGDFMLKSYSATGLTSKLGLGLLGYTGVIISLIWSFKTGNVLVVNGLWDGMSTIIESLAIESINCSHVSSRLRVMEVMPGLISL